MTADVAVTLHRSRFATPPADRVVWPAAFGRRYLVTVDVEEEFDWQRPFTRSARQVEAVAALPGMHARLADEGVAPVYLVDHPVSADRRAIATVAALATGGAEIGAQLHPWVNPPHLELPGEGASFAGNLPTDLEAAKLDALVAAIEAGTGRRPRAYRAGRYGLGPASLDLLAARGLTIDTSMRARHDYRAQGGPDYSAVGNAAFRARPAVLELPLSTIDLGLWRSAGAWLPRLARRLPRGPGLLARTGLHSRVPLTPEGVSEREAVAAVEAAAGDGERLLVLSFHSPSLVPGNTPYVRDAADLGRFHGWWDAVLPALARHGFAPASLEQVVLAAGEDGVVGPAGLEPAT